MGTWSMPQAIPGIDDEKIFIFHSHAHLMHLYDLQGSPGLSWRLVNIPLRLQILLVIF